MEKVDILLHRGGDTIKVPLTDIKSAGYIQGKFVMLANMANGLSDQDFLDLTAYLRSLKYLYVDSPYALVA
jgi:cytochrome c553